MNKIIVVGYGTLGKKLAHLAVQNNFSFIALQKYNPLLKCTMHNWKFIEGNILCLTVKTDQLLEACNNIKRYISIHTNILSFLPATSIQDLQFLLPGYKINRAMVNINVNNTESSSNVFVTALDKNICKFFTPHKIHVVPEDKIDNFTITHACTPAIWAYVMKSLNIPYASEQYYHILASMQDTIYLLKHYKPDDIMQQIACKDGITANMLQNLNQHNTTDIFTNIMIKAHEQLNNMKN